MKTDRTGLWLEGPQFEFCYSAVVRTTSNTNSYGRNPVWCACGSCVCMQNKITHLCVTLAKPLTLFDLQSSLQHNVGSWTTKTTSRVPGSSHPCDLLLAPLALLIFWLVPLLLRGKKSHHRLVWVCGKALGSDHFRLNCNTYNKQQLTWSRPIGCDLLGWNHDMLLPSLKSHFLNLENPLGQPRECLHV